MPKSGRQLCLVAEASGGRKTPCPGCTPLALQEARLRRAEVRAGEPAGAPFAALLQPSPSLALEAPLSASSPGGERRSLTALLPSRVRFLSRPSRDLGRPPPPAVGVATSVRTLCKARGSPPAPLRSREVCSLALWLFLLRLLRAQARRFRWQD